MLQFEPHDFKRLAVEVRRFLLKSDTMARLATIPVLYLELPDVGTMHHLHREIINTMPPEFLNMKPPGQPWDYPDDHTIRFEPYAGVTIVLSCKQRFAVQSGGSVAYRDIAFKTHKD
jgi:hypothetical protein